MIPRTSVPNHQCSLFFIPASIYNDPGGDLCLGIGDSTNQRFETPSLTFLYLDLEMTDDVLFKWTNKHLFWIAMML